MIRLTIALAMALGLAAQRAEAADMRACADLREIVVAPAKIGLPTGGATISGAQAVPATEQMAAHCLVSGLIKPIDPAAPAIRFQIALPTAWNGKALMLGGGGFSGTIPKVTANTSNTPDEAPSPLGRGYAVFGGDSGHENSPFEPGAFMLNEEALRNYRGDALKKTRDAAMAVIAAAYGRPPNRFYFIGGSTGGREALLLAGRWPKDWDGIVSLYPALHLITSVLGGQNMVLALAEPGAWLNPAKRDLLFRAALANCDGLDGADDGVISNVTACNARFDPARSILDGKPVRCPDGRDAGDDCLADTQLAALRRINEPVAFGFELASGDTHHPGYNAYLSDWGRPGDTQMHKLVSWIGFGFMPPAFPARAEMTLQTTYGDNFFRYTLGNGDLDFNSLTINPRRPSEHAARLGALSAPDAADTDLSAFAARNGKLLIVQGTADTITSPKLTEAYFERLQKSMGVSKVAEFVRFYEIAGWNHSFSTNFHAQWDYLSALEKWVEQNKDPAEVEVVRDAIGVPGRSRPLCLYPRWPRYDGSGDINAAASFTCSVP